MTTLELGTAPGPLLVRFTPGATFHAVLRAEADGEPVPWPTNTEMRLALDIGGVTARSYPFVIDGALATVTVPRAEVDELPQFPAPRAELWLTYEGQGEFLWLSGEVLFYG